MSDQVTCQWCCRRLGYAKRCRDCFRHPLVRFDSAGQPFIRHDETGHTWALMFNDLGHRRFDPIHPPDNPRAPFDYEYTRQPKEKKRRSKLPEQDTRITMYLRKI